jgi:hypothetical protein
MSRLKWAMLSVFRPKPERDSAPPVGHRIAPATAPTAIHAAEAGICRFSALIASKKRRTRSTTARKKTAAVPRSSSDAALAEISTILRVNGVQLGQQATHTRGR